MPIIDATGQRTELLVNPFSFFTDRNEAIRHFVNYLNKDPALNTILFFHGAGGNGKSLLLRNLREQYCKRLPITQWQQIRELNDEDLIAQVASADEQWRIPSAQLDFGMPPRGEERPTEAFAGLLMLRRSLGQHHLHFPLYDFATLWYLHKTHQLSEARLHNLYPAEEIGLITFLADAITKTAWGGIANAVLGIFNRQLREQFTLYLHQRKLTEPDLEKIQRLDPERELIDLMPELFAKDLNVSMRLPKAPERLALFFDTHEAFWGEQRGLGADRYFARDEWLRCLLTHLDLEAGIVAVIAGREPPHWDEAAIYNIPRHYVDRWLVGHFTPEHARIYLNKVGVIDDTLQEALIKYTEVELDQIHPLYLGLSSDVVKAAAQKGVAFDPEDFEQTLDFTLRQKELIERLLRYVDHETNYAVHALTACRAFDFEIYQVLGNALHFQTSQPAFEQLVTLSFVWQAVGRSSGWYRIHELLRSLLPQQDRELVNKSHEVMEAFYRQHLEDPTAHAEAIYHANQRDWERGVEEWSTAFDNALTYSRYVACQSLLDVRRNLRIDDYGWRGAVSVQEAGYFASLSRYRLAEREYDEAIDAFTKAFLLVPDDVMALGSLGIVHQRRGVLLVSLSKHKEAEEAYQQAIDTYTKVLSLAPDDVIALGNLGNVHQSRGVLLINLFKHKEAEEAYQQAIDAYTKAFLLVPDDVIALGNRGNVYQRRGVLLASLSKHKEAEEAYQQAIDAYTKGPSLAPDHVIVLGSLGNVHQRRGDLLANLFKHKEAEEAYQQAIDAFTKVLSLAPDDVMALGNLGNVHQSRGDLLASLFKHKEAEEAYQQAIDASTKALSLAPDYVMALGNLGLVHQRRGDLLASLSKHKEAEDTYQQAIGAFTKALSLAPDHVIALGNLGNVHQSRGDLLASLSKHKEAEEAYQQAIDTYTKAFLLAPDDVIALGNRGNVHQSRGDLLASLFKHKEAEEAYQQAIDTYTKVLSLAPDYVMALGNLGNVHQRRGDLLASLSKHKEAEEAYQQAIDAYTKALSLAPDYVIAWGNLGNVHQERGDLLASLSKHKEAEEAYQQAIDAFTKALSLAPDDDRVWGNLGLVQQSRGDLLATQSRFAAAEEAYQQAIEAFSKTLSLAPGDFTVNQGLVFALASMTGLRDTHTNYDWP